MKQSIRSDFFGGLYHGAPVGLAYLSVAIGFGILAVSSGFSSRLAALISVTNFTSAGQVAGVGIMAAGGTLFEMILSQLTINLRFSLMGISLTQKIDERFTPLHRMLACFCLTDQTFAVCAAKKGVLTPAYMYGVGLSAYLGWIIGTIIGSTAGTLLPKSVTSAMGILLYAMFLALVIPPAKKQRAVLIVLLFSAAFSSISKYLLTFVSSGFAVIICAVAASALGALLFPSHEENSVKKTLIKEETVQ